MPDLADDNDGPGPDRWSRVQHLAGRRAGISPEVESRLTLIGSPLHRRARQVAEAAAHGCPLIVVRAPMAFTAEQASSLHSLAHARQCLLIEWSAANKSRYWERGLGLDESPDTVKLLQIAATSALFPRYGHAAHGELLDFYLGLLDNEGAWTDNQETSPGAEDPPEDPPEDPVGESDLATWRHLLRVLDEKGLLDEQASDFAEHRFRSAVGAISRAAARDAAVARKALAAGASGFPTRPGDHDTFTRPRTVVVGAGMAATIHSGLARRHGPVAAVVARTIASAAGLASLHGALALDTLDAVTPDMAEQVIVATPPPGHFAAAARGIELGARVLVEKPLSGCLADADRLFAMADRCAATVVYGENWPYRPWLIAAAALAAGTRPRHAATDCQWPHPRHGDYAGQSYGGGVLFDSGSHALALIRLILSPGRAIAVQATLGWSPHSRNDVAAQANVEFEHGRSASLALSWRAQAPRVTAWGADFTLNLAPDRSLVLGGSPVPVAAVSDGGPWADSGAAGLHEVLAGLAGSPGPAGHGGGRHRDNHGLLCQCRPERPVGVPPVHGRPGAQPG